MQTRIPPFNTSGVLPPYVGSNPAQPATLMSPYAVSAQDLVERFGFSPQRRIMLRGWLAYREALRHIGLNEGFQWLNGSFLEDIEAKAQRSPGDIDLVTFARRPVAYRDAEAWARFNSMQCAPLGQRAAVKARYHCDAFLVDLDDHPESLVDSTRYWFGLFSHQRINLQWKGILRIPLAESFDLAAQQHLDRMGEEDGFAR